MPYIRQLIKQKQMKKNITIPQTLNDITLKQWIEYTTLEEPTNERMVSLFCNISGNELLNLPNKIYSKAVDGLSDVIDSCNGKQTLTLRFKLGGVEYGMIPNLDEITYGENKDLLAMLTDWKTMDKAMAVLYRPITKSSFGTYEIEQYSGKHIKENSKFLEHMPLDIVLGAKLFFWSLTNELLRCIPSYLERMIDKEMTTTQQEELSKKLGVDTKKHITLLKETLEDLTK